MRGCTVTFHLASSEWELWAAGVGTGVKWSRRGVQLLEVREMSTSGGGYGAEIGACISGGFELWLQTAELT